MPLLARASMARTRHILLARTVSAQNAAGILATCRSAVFFSVERDPRNLQSFGIRGHGLRCSHVPLRTFATESKSASASTSGTNSANGDTASNGSERDIATPTIIESEAAHTSPADSTSSTASASALSTNVAQDGVVTSVDDILIKRSRQDMIARAGPAGERYLPNEDPNTFLLANSRLDESERKWQKVFVAFPWAVFLAMLTVPFVLVRSNLPFLQQKAEDDGRLAAARNAALAPSRLVPDFAVVNFGQMPDVLERPIPTLVMLFDLDTFASRVFLPACRDLAALLKAAEIPVAVAALDLSAAPCPPDDFLWERPRATCPHFQLILPRAQDGEAGVVEYDGRWSARGLAEAARSLAGPYAPPLPDEEVQRVELGLERLRDAMFEAMFLDGEESAPAAKRPGFVQRLFGRAGSVAQAEGTAARPDISAAVREALLTGGLEAAASACEASRGNVKTEAKV